MIHVGLKSTAQVPGIVQYTLGKRSARHHVLHGRNDDCRVISGVPEVSAKIGMRVGQLGVEINKVCPQFEIVQCSPAQPNLKYEEPITRGSTPTRPARLMSLSLHCGEALQTSDDFSESCARSREISPRLETNFPPFDRHPSGHAQASPNEHAKEAQPVPSCDAVTPAQHGVEQRNDYSPGTADEKFFGTVSPAHLALIYPVVES